MRPKTPLDTIQRLTEERFKSAKAVFWAGSVSQNQGTGASDLDLVIVFESLPCAYRQAFIYNGWPIDAFVYDPDTLRNSFEESKSGNGISGLIEMIIYGKEVLEPSPFSRDIYKVAQSYKESGPAIWSQAQVDKERFLITDILDDIKFPKNREEQVTSAVHLYEPLIQFYFRADKKWAASGKSLMRLFIVANPNLAVEFNQSFTNLVQTGDASGIEQVVQTILAPYGGLLWDGFRSDASPNSKITTENNSATLKTNESEKIYLLELLVLDPITRQSVVQLDQLIADTFYEIGASGKIYTKKDLLESLPLEAVNNCSLGQSEVTDFELNRISEDLIRVNYTLKEKTRNTQRTSIWEMKGAHYQMIFHQGTVILKNDAN